MKERLLQISYEHKLSHLGSCLTALPIIDEIYKTKRSDEKFILSSGHAGLALYVVLESLGDFDAELAIAEQGIHPDRLNSTQQGIDCSTGSLGQGLPIAVGMALADRSKNVYCLISDGECAEGSIWEALTIAEKLKLSNLKIYANLNGYSAYDEVNLARLARRLSDFDLDINLRYTDVEQYPFLKGLGAHYYTMNEDDYRSTKE